MTYLMDSASEGARLRRKTVLPAVHEELLQTGLREGLRALDAGCASGAVSAEMASIVGPSGSVTGVDLSVGRVREARAHCGPELRASAAELARLPFESGAFDYTLCRLVLEYLRDPLPAVRELLRVTARDGKVVLADVDGYFSFHHPVTPEREESLAALRKVFAATGFDPFVGRKLRTLLREAGAQDVRVHLRPYHLIAGAADMGELANWTYKMETLAPYGRRVIGSDWDVHASRLLDMVADPEVLTYSVLFLVEGRPA